MAEKVQNAGVNSVEIKTEDGWDTAQSAEGGAIEVDAGQKLTAQVLRLVHEGEDIGLDVGVFFLPDGELADHVPEPDADGPHQGTRSAAARHRRRGRQDLCKRCYGVIDHFHNVILCSLFPTMPLARAAT